jgi:hypothetical protein
LTSTSPTTQVRVSLSFDSASLVRTGWKLRPRSISNWIWLKPNWIWLKDRTLIFLVVVKAAVSLCFRFLALWWWIWLKNLNQTLPEYSLNLVWLKSLYLLTWPNFQLLVWNFSESESCPCLVLLLTFLT